MYRGSDGDVVRVWWNVQHDRPVHLVVVVEHAMHAHGIVVLVVVGEPTDVRGIGIVPNSRTHLPVVNVLVDPLGDVPLVPFENREHRVQIVTCQVRL